MKKVKFASLSIMLEDGTIIGYGITPYLSSESVYLDDLVDGINKHLDFVVAADFKPKKSK